MVRTSAPSPRQPSPSPQPTGALVPDRLREAAKEHVKDGEELLAGCFTVIGPSVLVCGWLGPLTLAMFRDKKHLLLTTKRVLIIDAVAVSTRPGGLFAAIPRDRVVFVSAKPGRIINVLRLDVAGNVLRIEVDRYGRAAFDVIAAALAGA